MKLIFIHGSGSYGAIWRLQTDCFKDADALDLPGHPQGRLCGSVEEYVDWLHEYIRNKGYKDAVLAGHSLGGGIVLAYALKYPQDLKGIITVGSGARLRVMPALLEAIRDKLDDTQGWLNELVVPLYATIDVSIRDMMLAKLAAIGPAAQLNDFLCCDKFDIMQHVSLIKVPALAIVGDNDTMTPVKYSQYLVKNMPDCRMTLVEGATHLAFLEKPGEVNRAIQKFLKEIESGDR
ncbi:MAG: alpha/beta hydrolase [Dehalococcoidia bacterium]|nr:alpha/beta hydrolase [Dehalococcoidia bacterium]MDD5493583.1 alpha/beta hydrolase [Dehalococcoidia bacterium]